MDMLEIGNQKALLETGNQMTKSIYVDFHPHVSGTAGEGVAISGIGESLFLTGSSNVAHSLAYTH